MGSEWKEDSDLFFYPTNKISTHLKFQKEDTWQFLSEQHVSSYSLVQRVIVSHSEFNPNISSTDLELDFVSLACIQGMHHKITGNIEVRITSTFENQNPCKSQIHKSRKDGCNTNVCKGCYLQPCDKETLHSQCLWGYFSYLFGFMLPKDQWI